MAEEGGEKKDGKKKGNWQKKFGNFSKGGNSNFSTPKGEAVAVGNLKEMQWRHFLSVSDFSDIGIQSKIAIAKEYLEDKIAKDDNAKAFPLKFSNAVTDLKEKWPNLKDDLVNNAHKVLGIFGQGASQDKKKVLFPRLRSFNLKPTPMEHLKSSQVNRLLLIKGTVIRVANVMQMHTWLTFQCLKCENLCSVEQKPKGRYVKPQSCPTKGCRSQTFTEMRTNSATITINSQMIRLQENSQNSGGRVPRTVNCHLTRDLCDSVGVGDVVNVIAVAKVTTEQDQSYNLYLEAVSILNGASKVDKSQIEFTYLDYTAIREIFDIGPELFKLFVASICPSIYGHELVKAGLVLALFGGM